MAIGAPDNPNAVQGERLDDGKDDAPPPFPPSSAHPLSREPSFHRIRCELLPWGVGSMIEIDGRDFSNSVSALTIRAGVQGFTNAVVEMNSHAVVETVAALLVVVASTTDDNGQEHLDTVTTPLLLQALQDHGIDIDDHGNGNIGEAIGTFMARLIQHTGAVDAPPPPRKPATINSPEGH